MYIFSSIGLTCDNRRPEVLNSHIPRDTAITHISIQDNRHTAARHSFRVLVDGYRMHPKRQQRKPARAFVLFVCHDMILRMICRAVCSTFGGRSVGDNVKPRNTARTKVSSSDDGQRELQHRPFNRHHLAGWFAVHHKDLRDDLIHKAS